MFVYFDLGNVLLNFSHDLACEQIGRLTAAPADRVRQSLFDSGLQSQFETGLVTGPEVYESLCRATGARPSYDELSRAAADIFWVNMPVKALLGALHAAGHRMGILSNTCEWHWEMAASGRYRLIPEAFDVLALSYRLKSMKPARSIYDQAAALAGVPQGEIFFVDDRQENVAAAREAGFDAVLFTTAAALAADLRQRGVYFNF